MTMLKKVPEIAPRLQLSPARVYELIRKGYFSEGIVCRFGRQIRVNEALLIRFLENGAPNAEGSEDYREVDTADANDVSGRNEVPGAKGRAK